MTRSAAIKSLLSLAWGLVRYAEHCARNDLLPSPTHAAAELRWKLNCDARWAEFRLARDEWRRSA